MDSCQIHEAVQFLATYIMAPLSAYSSRLHLATCPKAPLPPHCPLLGVDDELLDDAPPQLMRALCEAGVFEGGEDRSPARLDQRCIPPTPTTIEITQL